MRTTRVLCNKGQSILEFVLMLPLMIGLVVLMIRVNSAIQVSIVNQQYARSQALWLAHNSPIYPHLGLQADMAEKGYNQIVLGVSADKIEDQGETPPKATEMRVTRSRTAPKGSNAAQEEPNLRDLVRVRTTVTLCTQSNVIAGEGGRRVPIVGGGLSEGVTPQSFIYCRGPLDE